MVNSGRFSLNSAALRGPGMTAATTGWASGNCSAAAGSGTLWDLQTAAIFCTRVDDLGRGGVVVPGVAAGQDAGVQRAADDQRGAAGLAQRDQVVERRLFQQRVAAGEQEGVPVAEAQRVDQDLAFR